MSDDTTRDDVDEIDDIAARYGLTLDEVRRLHLASLQQLTSELTQGETYQQARFRTAPASDGTRRFTVLLRCAAREYARRRADDGVDRWYTQSYTVMSEVYSDPWRPARALLDEEQQRLEARIILALMEKLWTDGYWPVLPPIVLWQTCYHAAWTPPFPALPRSPLTTTWQSDTLP